MKNLSAYIVFMLLLAIAPLVIAKENEKVTPIPQQNSVNPYKTIFLNSLGGNILRLKVVDHIALLLRSQALEFLDVTNPDHPFLVSRIPLTGQVTDMTVREHSAFIGVRDQGVHIIDFSNPRTPLERGFIPLKEAEIDLGMEGSYLRVYGHYRADGDYQYMSLPPSHWDPTPSWQEEYQATDRNRAIGDIVLRLKPENKKKALNLFVKPGATKEEHLALTFTLQEGNKDPQLVVLGKNGVILSSGCAQIIDLSQPANPVALGRIAIPWGDYWKVEGDFERFILLSSYTGTNTFSDHSKLALLDVANPREPKFILWDYAPPRLEKVWFLDSLLIARIELEDKNNNSAPYHYSYMAFDISDPARPIERKLPLPDMTRIEPLIHGNKLYAFTADGKLQILDCSNPTEIRLCGSLTGINGLHYDVVMSNSLIYLCNTKGLEIIDVSDANRPRRRGNYYAAGQDVRTIAVANQEHIGAVAWIVNRSGQLESIIVGNPAKPELIGHLELNGDPVDIKAKNNIACIATEDAGVFVVDISKPEKPLLLASIKNINHPNKLAFTGHLLLITTENDGLLIYDLNDPKNPQSRGSYKTKNPCADIAILGHFAFLACKDLDIVDISDPIHPHRNACLSCFSSDEDFRFYYATCVLIQGNIAYTPQYVDISHISSPKLIDNFESNPPTERYLSKSGNNVFLLQTFHHAGGSTYSIVAFDATDPAHPRKVSEYDALIDTKFLYADENNTIYVADGEGGLIFLRLESSTTN